MNIELLQKVRDAILAEPRRFNMGYWVTDGVTTAPCGTAACIGGYALVLNKMEEDKTMDWVRGIHYFTMSPGWIIVTDAQRVLGLTLDQRSRLFNDNCWPNPYRDQLRSATDPAKAAKIAADRIDLFIRTGGTDTETN